MAQGEFAIGAGACCYCIVLITSCILLGVSWDVIEPTEVGIIFDRNIQKVEGDRVFTSGRRLVGLGRSYIKFPSTYQTLRFGDPNTLHYEDPDAGEISCRTRDGLKIQLEVAVQYQLSTKADDLYRLYLDTGGDKMWESLYIRIVQKVVRDVASLYDNVEFRMGRDVIAMNIHSELNKAFNEVYAMVPTSQLINMEIESDLADAITATRVAEQDRYQAANEKQVSLVEAQKRLGVSQKLTEIKIKRAEEQSQAIYAVANATAQIIQNNIDNQIKAYSELKDSLSLSQSSELLSYLWLQAMQSNNVKDLVLSLQYPALLT